MLAIQDSSKGDKEHRVPRFSTSYMDVSVDPHEDFYRYSVGKWLDENPVPEDKTRWASFNELYERNLLLLKSILEDCASDTSAQNGSTRRLIGDFYKSAMDTKRIEELGFIPIDPILHSIKGLRRGTELGRFLALLRTNGINAFFVTYSAADKKNSREYAFYLDQGGLSLPDREYYLSDSFSSVREAYRIHIARMFALAGESEEEGKHLAGIVLRMETELAKASRSRTDLRDETRNYNRISVSDLGSKFPSSDLAEFLKTSSVPASEFVLMGQPEFFDRLEALLSEESLDNLGVFLRWKVLHGCAPHLHSSLENEDFHFFHRKLLGQAEPEPRWKRATRIIDDLLGEALGSVYVERFFPPEAKRSAALMIDDLREVFKDRLANLAWMTEATKKEALAKFARFRVKIGYPENFRDYSSIRIEPDDYLGNIFRSSEFEALRHSKRVGREVDWSEWLMTPPTVDAYFHPMENTINFPAGILQPPFFDMTLDDAVNYGSIGSVIGHEITHGYDDQGRRFDSEGNLRDWWTREDEEGFEKRASAVVELYDSQFPFPDAHVNGKLTLGENIADFGGVSLALEALERRLQKEPIKRKIIDGLTPEQRFFIAYSQIWRANVRDEEARRLLTIDPHSPMRYRGLLPAVNHPGFDLAFPPKSSGLDRKEPKVAVW
jgi:putative endopeptidase